MTTGPDGHRLGRLSARPGTPTAEPLRPGTSVLDAEGARDGLLVMPADLPDAPLPLVVYLHGAGGHPMRDVALLEREAARDGFLLLAPKSRAGTWDAIRGVLGPDVRALDRLLTVVFARWPVDPERIALAGFSDGASYALTVGLANGDLFRRVLAYSPGFIPPAPREGTPRVFVSHGTRDRVLPIARCSRVIVPALRGEGYDVEYVEFDGEHTVPASAVATSLAFLSPRPDHD
ncbi:MAG TPA: alpha/beta hydrolase-fold protein [Naasia sp.]|jgi:phospholipase/carboxylesterase